MEIVLNGRKAECRSRDLYQLREEFGLFGEVVIVNGYQTAENLLLGANDVVTVIEKGKLPDKTELESMMAARHSPQVHERVKAGSVAVAGLGGLGSNIAEMLARTGVGRLLLVDFDTVEPSNLNRQNYMAAQLGMPKAEAAGVLLREINPFIQVESAVTKVTPENIAELFGNYDIICEAFDRADQKAMLINTVLEAWPDKKIVAASGMAGYGSANQITTRRVMKHLYICGDFESEAEPGNGLMAPRVNVCAGHQANMVLRLLLGVEEP